MGTARLRWKEELVYESDGDQLVFEAPMGRVPCPVFVPTADAWPTRVPAWARDRREEILGAIRRADGVAEIVESEEAWVVARKA